MLNNLSNSPINAYTFIPTVEDFNSNDGWDGDEYFEASENFEKNSDKDDDENHSTKTILDKIIDYNWGKYDHCCSGCCNCCDYNCHCCCCDECYCSPNCEIDCKYLKSSLIDSVAKIEVALSGIIHAEGEKIQRALDHSLCMEDILKVNDSVKHTISQITKLENLLLKKLELAKTLCD